MSEPKAEYQAGNISVEIEHPRRVSSRKAHGEFEEKTLPAWIKFSTAFKEELADIDGNTLKVWIFLALSVDYQGEAFPSIRTIAKNTKMSHTTVIDCIKSLENLGLLTVRRGEKRFNIYEVTDDYVKVGAEKPFQILERSAKNVTENAQIVTENDENVTVGLTLTRINKNQQELRDEISKSSVEWAFLAGKDVTPEMAESFALKENASKEFERALGFSRPLPWGIGKAWEDFEAWVVKKYSENRKIFDDYEAWRNVPFVKGAISNQRIRGFPNEFYDSFDMFLKNYHPEPKETKVYRPEDDKQPNYVPAPERK